MSKGKYEKSAERANPACIVFLLDQSYSMNDGISGTPKPKIEVLEAGINRFIADLISLCEKGEEEGPRHYFDVGVIGYTTDRSDPPISIVGPVLRGEKETLTGRDLLSVPELFNDTLALEDRERTEYDDTGGLIKVKVKFPVWYRKPDPSSMGGTAMCRAIEYVKAVVEPWCALHSRSFPPVVIHLSDGEATDGDPEAAAAALKHVSTDDGELLFFNCHISESQAQSVVFPSSELMLTDERAKVLFRMSSELPESVRSRAEVKGISCAPGARGMVFNADAAQMIQLIQMGTVGAQVPTLPQHR
jgi:uncharacterized protein YegL